MIVGKSTSALTAVTTVKRRHKTKRALRFVHYNHHFIIAVAHIHHKYYALGVLYSHRNEMRMRKYEPDTHIAQ